MFECSMAIDHSGIVDFSRSSSCKPISHGYVDILFHSILCDVDSPGRFNLGTEIQEVRGFFSVFEEPLSLTSFLSIASFVDHGTWLFPK